MKAFLVLSAILATCAANTVLLRREPFIPIKTLRHDLHHSGQYNMHSEGMDGTVFLESGTPSGAKTGSFSYISPEGEHISTQYVADELGFRATGSHFPVPPPMPEAIRAMLPTLPKLVEVTEARHFLPLPAVRAPTHFIHREPVLFESRHLLAPAPVLIQEPAPTKTFVRTNDFHIDSSPTRTQVRIGN